jgi:hypothetical protein
LTLVRPLKDATQGHIKWGVMSPFQSSQRYKKLAPTERRRRRRQRRKMSYYPYSQQTAGQPTPGLPPTPSLSQVQSPGATSGTQTAYGQNGEARIVISDARSNEPEYANYPAQSQQPFQPQYPPPASSQPYPTQYQSASGATGQPYQTTQSPQPQYTQYTQAGQTTQYAPYTQTPQTTQYAQYTQPAQTTQYAQYTPTGQTTPYPYPQSGQSGQYTQNGQ